MYRKVVLAALLAGAALPASAQETPTEPLASKPAALTAEGIPPLPLALAANARTYLEARGAGFAGWDPKTRAILITTRFANVSQLHRVAMPMGARTQISFEAEPVNGSYAPQKGDVVVVS